jgi:acetyl esterase/lipase
MESIPAAARRVVPRRPPYTRLSRVGCGDLMKPLIFALCGVFAFGGLHAQMPVWQPAVGHVQVPIWPGTAPDAQPVAGPEFAVTAGGKDALVGGKPWVAVENVSQPTMTVYSPKGKNTGAAVIVFPGGGYQILAIDLEGTEVCDWLTAKGITCVLLKYRVPGEGRYPKSGPYPKSPVALEDAQRTLGLVRFHAAEWHIDPHKIGVLGFSAGGHMVAAMSVHFERRLYRGVDAADKESCRPDFAVAIYPGHLLLADNSIALNPDIGSHITRQTPPTFLLQNEDDHVDRVEDSLSYYVALKKAGVPVEMHLYAQGGHAFGLRRTKLPATAWPQLVETWLRTIGMISE